MIWRRGVIAVTWCRQTTRIAEENPDSIMQLNPRYLVTAFAHVLQEKLFPALETVTGSLNPQMKLLVAITALIPLERMISARRAATGRPPKDRAALSVAFIARAVLNLPGNRELMRRLRVDETLRRLCGWSSVDALPDESTFSRAFAEFAMTELPQQLHAEIIAATQQQRIIGHIARDSTAIPARERCDDALLEKKRAEKEAKAKEKEKRRGGSKCRKKHEFQRRKAAERGTRIERQRSQKFEDMLKELPRACDFGAKTNSQGNEQYWRGYKLHLDVADGQLPVSAVLTSASVHDSQVAIPLMTMTSRRVTHLYELMDSAYDADGIHEHSRHLKHVPIIAPHPRRGTKKSSQLPKIFPDKPTPQLTWAQQERYKTRTMSERVNARLKDEFGASHIRVRGAVKVMAHLMFGVLALTVDQWLRLKPPS